MSNFKFFKSLYENNKQHDNIILDNDYLDSPPKHLNDRDVIPNPVKTSDFQKNSIIFIKNLINKILSPLNKINIDDVNTNIKFFILLINELIKQISNTSVEGKNNKVSEFINKISNTSAESYYNKLVFLFFLYFLYFMNFRLGQIFLYYVFFEIRKMSNSLSNIFQELIEYSMTYSVVDLHNISFDNNNFKNVILPNTTNVKISYNEFTLPDYSIMKEFIPTLKNNTIFKNNNNNNSTQKNPMFDTFKQLGENTELENTKKEYNKINQEYEKVEQEYQDSNVNLNKLFNEANELIKNVATSNAAVDAAIAAVDTAAAAVNTAVTAANIDEANRNLIIVKHNLEEAFINSRKTSIQCNNVAKELLSGFIKNKNLKNDFDNANSRRDTIVNAFKNVNKMSNIAKKIIINSKYDTNQIDNNEYISYLEKYIPTTNKIDVNAVIKTMNELSIIIAKKYNGQALKKEKNLHGGKKTYLTKSIKANRLKHICKKHSMRKYKHKYCHHT